MDINELRCCIVLLIFYGVAAYPIGIESEDKSELRDEKRYPNGTVVGKYTYKDREGNPVHVKYFAEGASYGVELKSFKVIDSKYPVIPPDKQSKSNSPIKTEIVSDTDYLTNNNMKIDKSFEVTDDKTQPISNRKSEFEIFIENDLKPEKCGKEKVRVYYDKNNKRKVRNVFYPYETFLYCNRF